MAVLALPRARLLFCERRTILFLGCFQPCSRILKPGLGVPRWHDQEGWWWFSR